MRTLLVPLLSGLFAFSSPAQDPVQLREAAQAAVESGKWEDAASSFRKLTEVEPKEGRNWQMLGYSLHAAGKLDEALAIHMKATEFKGVAGIAAYNVACVHSLKGDKDKAFEWLGKSVTLGFADPGQLAGDTDFDNLRKDPRWAELEQKVAAKAKGAVSLYVITTPRHSARAAFFSKKGSPGQLALDWGKVEWKAKYDQAIASPEFVGKKWRFGSDAWTSLDTSMPVLLGEQKFAPGYYYLTLEHKTDGSYVLGVHDAAEVKQQQLDAYQAHRLTGGTEVALEYGKVEQIAPELMVRFELEDGQHAGKLVVHFGGHQLSTPFAVKPLQ
jgi:tetratricopeptide (TPR) repeat protein